MYALNHNWTVMADPFYAMNEREGFSLSAVQQIQPQEAIRGVLGDVLTERIIKDGRVNSANSVQFALFAAFSYLNLRQKQRLEFPIELDMPFHFANPQKQAYITGLEVLKQYGKYVAAPKFIGTATAEYRSIAKDTDRIEALSDAYELEKWAVRQALLTGCMATQSQGVYLLTYAACRPLIEDMFGVQDLVRYVQPGWARMFDFNATAKDVAVVIDWIAGALSKGGVSPIEVTAADDGFSVWMDGYEFQVTSKDGVFEKGRNLRFNNMLMLDSLTGYLPEVRIDGSSLSLINSYGTFLYGLIMLGAPYLSQAVPELGQLVSKKLLVELPCTSDDEARAYDGDRATYDRYVTVTRMSPADLPLGFARYPNAQGEWETKITYNRDIAISALGDITVDASGSTINRGIVGMKPPAKNAVDAAALLTFNMVRMPRGQFIDARRSCIQAKHIPSVHRAGFVRSVIAEITGDNAESVLAEYCRNTYKLNGSDSEVLAAVEENLIVGLSSKLAKLIKRTAMDAACVGKFSKGGRRGFKRFGFQKEQSVNNWLVEAVVSPHAIFPAGMAAYWGENPDLVVKHTQTVQPCVPGLGSEVESAVVPLYKGFTKVDREGWFVIRYDRPVQLDAGEPVADIPYVVGESKYRHTLCTNTAEGYLVEIRWRLAKLQGNNAQLQVVIVTETRERQIKGRNNVKCMLSRYTPDVVINELNENLNARSVFFADTNKWLDLVMSLVDVASCTAIENGDAEGLSLIAAANTQLKCNSTEYLEWSPVAAVLGLYQPLVDWFEAKYGRAVWFRHADATHEWVHVLRTMYNSANGWTTIQPETVGFAIPAGAVDVAVYTDGPTTDERNNVLVFYVLDGVSYFVQRAWSYAGVDSPVWQPVKGELSSVRAAVGKTSMMAGVARAIAQQDADYARKVTSDGFAQVHKSAVLFAMVRNQTIKAKGGAQLPMYMLGDENAATLMQTDELRALVNDPENAGKLLKVLAPLFKDVMFSICCGAHGHFSVYLPAVLMQDSASDFRSVDGLSDLITRLVVLYIQGVPANSKEFLQIAGRAKGALSKLASSAALIKSGAFCRESVQAKTQALPGIPVSEVWVRESLRTTSVHQTMVRTFGK